MINCIVVDDEPLARELICSYVDQVPGMLNLGNYQNAAEAFVALHEYKVNVIFIDIEMPGINGLNFIRSLKVLPMVVFITAYTEYAVDAFEVEATDYLVKPVTFERFLKTARKIGASIMSSTIESQHTSEIGSVFLKVDRRLVKIELVSIIYIEALGDYLKVHTTNHTYVTYMGMSKLIALLPTSRFIRIHRSTIINTSMIQFVEGNFIRINDIDLPIGPTFKDSVMRGLGEK